MTTQTIWFRSEGRTYVDTPVAPVAVPPVTEVPVKRIPSKAITNEEDLPTGSYSRDSGKHTGWLQHTDVFAFLAGRANKVRPLGKPQIRIEFTGHEEDVAQEREAERSTHAEWYERRILVLAIKTPGWVEALTATLKKRTRGAGRKWPEWFKNWQPSGAQVQPSGIN